MRQLLCRCAAAGFVLLAVQCGDSGEGSFRGTDAGGGRPSSDVEFDAGSPEGGQGGPCQGDDCTTEPVCGDGVIGEGEFCDDGNARPGDGCSGLCRLEPHYVCEVPGEPCASTIVCGDSEISGNEACDDGNAESGDGCSSECQVEEGYACAAAGEVCIPVETARCGDGRVNAGETCDDGGQLDGDGCSELCQLEGGYTCPVPGEPCELDEYCGDSILNGTEQCDDGNAVPGDGCTGTCRLEDFYECKTPGEPCVSTIVCGDERVVADEACDDGNVKGGDGCSADCKRVEGGYTCPKASGVGGPCIALPEEQCGDGLLSYGEFCDDGNVDAGDGCDADCKVESGFTCGEAGTACERLQWCGDGKLSVANAEQCDDGNDEGGDGCSSQCIIEADFVCPEPGSPCQSTVTCGDQAIGGSETCDDGNDKNNDGCSSSCQIESGWICPIIGSTCRAERCGDGIVAGREECDDRNTKSNDGCSSACVLENPSATEKDGWVCSEPGKPCVRTDCGDGDREGSEQCDDGNNNMGDGCTPFCRVEPDCPASGGACSTGCGDGLLLDADIAAGQECDDGNTVSGDGCSKNCKEEEGYTCVDTEVTTGDLILPIVYRDFIGKDCTGYSAMPAGGCDVNTGSAPHAHDDFNEVPEGPTILDWQTDGTVKLKLGTDGKPVYSYGAGPFDPAKANGNTTGSTNFQWWYRDNSTYNTTVLDTMTLAEQGAGIFLFEDTSFWPLDGRGWVGAGEERTILNNNDGIRHNYHFTSEVRYWFEFDAAASERPVLTFLGDDDVWVFINKKLTVDIGGIHPKIEESVTLRANGDGRVETFDGSVPDKTIDLGLSNGGVYEIVVFQAERRWSGSNYKLTLQGFKASRSTCSSDCGDGFLTSDEACDLGEDENTGDYGTCNSDCSLAARCGDGSLQSTYEDCDDGTNLTTYGGTAQACAPGCVWAPYCGDGSVDGAHGEACDEGADNGAGYGHCTATCQLGPRCGDGAVSHGEECDDGNLNGTSSSDCMATCEWKCGNGTLDAGEQCDDGASANTGGYGKCRSDCSLGPRCGDGIKNGGEQCDDGKNDGSYGFCAPGCVLGPHCGDGAVQAGAGEVCDEGSANSASAYGENQCSNRCLGAPYCGDQAVDASFGEKCDDGENTGEEGSCKEDCSAHVPVPSCGDGTRQPPEECDDGGNNGTSSSDCDANCRVECGNGIKSSGEECDDGVNNGSYGTCSPGCTLAPHCGDGTVNGSEDCDLGAQNRSDAYGSNQCTTACQVAPYCGDGRIQSSFGEECDGSVNCTSNCEITTIQ